MQKFNVTFERTQFYTVSVAAENHDDAVKIAEARIIAVGAEPFYTCASKVEFADCWAEKEGR